MSSRASMFKCSQCDKVYKTRTSLTRHAHNHGNSPAQHACDTCGVVFARRDILNRHVTNGHCSASAAGRHRTHTACEPCRAARIKCDGRLPCRSCAGTRKDCKYPTKTGRISHATRPARAATIDPDSATEHDGDSSVSNGPVSGDGMTPPSQPRHDSARSDGSGSTYRDEIKPELHQSPGSDVQNVSWPWIHEKDYMLEGKKSANGPVSRPVSTVSGSGASRVNGVSASPAAAPPTSTPDLNGLSNGTFTETSSPLSNVIENLVAYAASTAFLPDDHSTRSRYWESVSLQLSEIWGYESVFNPRRALYELVQTYLDKFNILWPLLNHEQLDPDTHHPILFLVVTSVGAMCGKVVQREYGNLMHQRLRRLLCASLYDLEGPGDGMVWLAQARLLTQIASLYFGQHQSFSYAQHLAAITIAQLRRMDFFREPIPDHAIRTSCLSPEQELARFQHFECRRRIAFGILRADVYTSVLLNTRPLLTSEEVKLSFVRPDSLWLNTDHLSPEQRLAAYRMEDSRCLQMPFSDLVRIFFERNEPNPYLGPVGHELVLFGLQEAVWRFSQDPELFPRLTGRCLADTDITYTSRILANSEPTNGHIIPGSTGFWQRRMDDLHGDRLRLVRALDTWSSAVDLAISRGAYAMHRDTLMSSMLLYRLSKLRLCAPLEELHHISYRSAHPKTIDLHVHRKIDLWLESKFAREAAHLSWDVKMLIETNLARPPEEQARFNYLCFCSLHHAAVTLWTVAAINNNDPLASTFDIPNHAIELFLRSCPDIFRKLGPLGGNSFEAAAERMQRYRFPSLDPALK